MSDLKRKVYTECVREEFDNIPDALRFLNELGSTRCRGHSFELTMYGYIEKQESDKEYEARMQKHEARQRAQYEKLKKKYG